MQYAHTHTNDYFGPSSTFALNPPSKNDLHSLFTMHANQLMVLAGLSVASKHDQFNKKVGREVAAQRTIPRVAHFDGIAIEGTKHIYQFHTDIKVGFKEYKVHFQITTVAESEQVKLISCAVYE